MSTVTGPEKTCPQCKVVVAASEARCACGHEFDDSSHIDSPPSEELVAKAEQLYETFLGARLARARRAVNDARLALARDPRNRAKAQNVRLAEKEARTLQMQLAAQVAKTEKAQRIANDAKERLRLRRTRTEQTQGAVPSTPSEDDAHRAPEQFRRAQAIKAETIVAGDAIGDAAAHVHRPDQSPSASRPVDARPCPNCDAALPSDATGCACGHALRADDLLPPFLSDEDFRALKRGHLLLRTDKPGD